MIRACIPSRRLLALLAGWALLAAAAAAWAPLHRPAVLAGAGIGAVALLDLLLLLRPPRLEAQRRVPQTLSLGTWTEVELRLAHRSGRPVRLEVFDLHPEALESRGLPQRLRLPSGQFAVVRYQVRARRRGPQAFEAVQVLLHGPLGLWQRSALAGEGDAVQVYPDFEAVRRYALLATDHRLAQLGVLKRRRRGEGLDFHQLREYRQGDTLRQVDWKATARSRKLISREYQDERDQQVVFLLDGGRRMRAQDGESGHFDQALNAMLLLAHVALRQGDAVGLQTFACEDRWISPKKGPSTQSRLLHAVYDLEPTPDASDFLEAAERFLARVRKRSLVVLVTNVRDEDDEGLREALALLKRGHVVILASLREKALDQALDRDVEGFDDALLHGALHHYLAERRAAFERFQRLGVTCLDVLPEQLPLALVNRYLDLKLSGTL